MSAGWVPALSAGWSVSCVHSAAASWERAELWVHTNSAGCGASAAAGDQAVEGVAVEVDVAAAAVAAGAAAGDQPDLLEHVEVVGEQVRRDAGEPLQLDRGAVGAGQLVDDRQSGGIAERGVPLRSERHSDPRTEIMTQLMMSQELLSEYSVSTARRSGVRARVASSAAATLASANRVKPIP